MTHRMGTNGEIVIPAEIRRRLGLSPGDAVVIQIDEGSGSLRIVPSAALSSLKGRLAESGMLREHEAEHRAELEAD